MTMLESTRPKIRVRGNTLTVEDFPPDKISQQELTERYLVFEGLLKVRPESVSIDLKNVSPTDVNKLAFLDSCNILCRKFGIKINTLNCDPGVYSFINKTGIFATTSPRLKFFSRFWGENSILCTVGAASIQFVRDIRNFISFVGEISSVIGFSLLHPKKVQYKETLYYIDKTGPNGVPIVFLLCFLMGAILGYQGVAQMGKFGLSIFVPNLIGASIVKELGALMVAVICIGRAGSSYAAEIGTMKVSEEIDAMTTMGLRISRFLVIPKIFALIIVMPMLTLIGDIAGLLGGMVVCIFKAGMTPSLYYERILLSVKFCDFFEGTVKSIVFAVIIGAIGCLRGLESENDAKGVGGASTSAVVSGIFLMVVADAILTTIFN
jgi:phospholipid/cholesterol/gamma-HCH transport system permease protein